MAVCTDKNLEYLVRRFTLEKGFMVAGDAPRGGTEPLLTSLDQKRFGYDLPVVYAKELESLKVAVDVLLVRMDGVNVWLLALAAFDGDSLTRSLSRETLIEVGTACAPYAGELSGSKMPVLIDLIEVHRREPRTEAIEALNTLRMEHDPNLNTLVTPYSLNIAQGTVHARTNPFSIAGGRARYLRRILKITGETEHQMLERVENAGLNLPLATAGIVTGMSLAFGLRFLFATLGIDWDTLYGLADYAGAFTAVGISIYARRIRSRSMIQGLLGGLGYSLLLYGGFIFLLGAPLSLVLVFNAFVFTFTGAAIGHESEMA